MRLIAAGQRPVSNVVDVSNYVMLELGKPIHTFDAAAVHDGRIVVRPARPGERLETLDHVDRELTPDTLLIADPEGPLGIAGVMGGASSEISDATTRRRHRVGDLRPGHHPPDRVPLRAPLRGEPPLREGPGASAGEARARTAPRG